jgi:hypothetical protein
MVRCRSVDGDVIRRSHVSSVLLAVALLAASDPAAGAGGERSDGDAPRPPGGSTVRVALVVVRGMPKSSVETIRAEADRIWARNAVAIDWLVPGQATDRPPDLAALVGPESRSCLQPREKEEHALGCFMASPQRTGVSVIVVFPERATRMVRGWMSVLGARSPAGWVESRSATLLGRVLAHEIGHYLLGPAHTTGGLMRAQFEFRDLWTDRPDGYSLTDRAPEFVSSTVLPLRSRAAPPSEPTRR